MGASNRILDGFLDHSVALQTTVSIWGTPSPLIEARLKQYADDDLPGVFVSMFSQPIVAISMPVVYEPCQLTCIHDSAINQ
jgi:hypothetical protein